MGPAFNPLIDDLPESFTGASGEVYSIRSDFRQVLRYLRRVDDPSMPEAQKQLLGVRLFFVPSGGEILREDLPGLVTALSEFMSCGRPAKKTREAPVFDLNWDAGLVFAAFFQVYGINLRKAPMHWWTFCELLGALPSGTRLSEVIEVRAKPLPTGTTEGDFKERQRLLQLKEKYRIGGEAKKLDPVGSFFEFLKGVVSR